MPRFRFIRTIATEAGISYPVFGRFMRGERGTSLRTAERLAALENITAWQALGMEEKFAKLTKLGSVPGYALAEKVAREFHRGVPEHAWDEARKLQFTGKPKSITPEQLGDLARAIASLEF